MPVLWVESKTESQHSIVDWLPMQASLGVAILLTLSSSKETLNVCVRVQAADLKEASCPQIY